MSLSGIPEGRRTRSPLALALVAVALLAMAVVPIYMGRRAVAVQDRITEVLLPALESSARLSQIQAQQMATFQAFLLTADGAYRLQYSAAMQDEDSLYSRLSERVRTMDFDVRERLAAMSGVSTRWHFDNQTVFSDLTEPAEDPERLAASESTYQSLQSASRELERAIQSEVRAGRLALETVRRRQIWITIALSILAFGSTLVIARVGSRLRGFMHEAEKRRSDAVRSRREIDALLAATGDGVLGIDLSGKVTSLNRVGCELLGYTEQQIRDKDVHDTIHYAYVSGERRPRDESIILAALEDGARARSADDDVLWRRNGSAFPARWSLHPLIDGKEIRGAVLTFHDMTETRENEEALRRAVEQRDEVVSIVSHDLRNPLGVVSAAADLLIDLPLDAEERRKQAEIISRSAERMRRLIEDLLDVARIEAGALVVRPAAEEPRPLLDEVRTVYLDQAASAGVELCIGDTVSRTFKMDRDRIIQALSNLVDNAIRFTPAGGRVTLSAGECDAAGVVLRVADTGSGIPPHTLDHLFDRFWQADGAAKGTVGLGLTIVRGVVEAHGGSVSVDSEIGRGTTFSLRIPAGVHKERDGS